jgi:hypothetical protein
MNKAVALIVLLLAAGALVAAYGRFSGAPKIDPTTVTSFEACAAAYPVMESYPRQCRTPDGRTFAEEIAVLPVYENASADDIVVDLPNPGGVTGKSFTVTGKARGPWFFEASFPVELQDAAGTVIATGIAQAGSDWMTTEFVPFTAPITAPETYIGPASLVLRRDNPSGEPERDAAVRIPITVEY